ncbi:pseudouridine synthase [Nannochloropsis oceanica]
MSHFPRCFVVVNVLLLLRHPATAFIPRADHHCSSELKHSGLKACQLHTAHVSWLYDFTHGPEPFVLQAQARDGNSDLDKCARALDLSAAAQGSTVEEVLQLAGVPSRNVARALEAFIGLQDCDPHAETLRRLHHLNFIIEQGVYSFEEAMELISTQSRFLEMNFSFVYKDGDLLVMNKPSDVRMDVPQRDGGERKWPTEFTCSDWLDIPGLVDPPLDKKRFCHNLDSATSGILCVARNQAAAARVVDLFAERKVKKEYLAVVFGHVAAPPGSNNTIFIDAPIEKDPTSDFRMRIGPDGKAAQTQVHVLGQGYLTLQGPHYNAPVSKLLLKPITGRRHQLRVHTLSLGHGIVGDSYVEDWSTYRLMLHAHKLFLPISAEKQLHLETPDPFIGLLSSSPLGEG